jgi:signal transduction histidine kinase
MCVRAHVRDDTAAAALAGEPADLADVVAIVGHELRGPLSTITLAAELLRSADAADAEPLRRRLQRQAAKMQLLFDAALRAAAIAGGSPLDNSVRADLPSILASLRDAYIDDGLRIALRCDTSLRDVAIEPAVLTIIVNNLIANALRHSGSDEVSISAWTRDRRVYVSVADGGCGVSPRLTLTGKIGHEPGRSSGRGIGLHLVRSLARAHGGDIYLEERVRGACFVVELSLGRDA